MGVIASAAKKVWSGIKNIAKKIWNGIKTVAKKVVQVVKKVAVVIVNGIKKTIQVVASIALAAIKVIVSTFALVLFSPLILLLGIIFISSKIIFGRNNNDNNNNDENNNNENDNDDNNNENKESPVSQDPNNIPNFENEPKEKSLNLTNVFLEDTRSFINNVIQIPDLTSSATYTFDLKDDTIIVDKKKEEEISNDISNNYEPDILNSNVTYQYNSVQKYIKLSFENEINDIDLGKEIIKKIKNNLDRLFHNTIKILETEDDSQEVNIDNISNINTLLMIIPQ